MFKYLKASLIVFTVVTCIYSVEINLDVKGGLNIATMFGKPVDSLVDLGFKKTPTPGFCGGIGLELILTEQFSLQPELLLSMKGTEFTKIEGDIEEQMDSEYLYLTLPVICKGNFNIRKVGLNPFAGVVPALNIMSDYETSRVDLKNPDSDYDITVNTTESVQRVKLGVVAGLELEIHLKTGSVILDIRNTMSLLETEFSPSFDAYHTVLSVMAGYRFSLRK